MNPSTTLSHDDATANLARIEQQVDPHHDTPALQAVFAFLRAQLRRDFAGAEAFFTDDVLFNGLVLQVKGRKATAEGIAGFLASADVRLDFDAVAHVEKGASDRVLALYRFQLPGLPPQALCDHYIVRGGKIARIDNIFDVSKLPPMPS